MVRKTGTDRKVSARTVRASSLWTAPPSAHTMDNALNPREIMELPQLDTHDTLMNLGGDVDLYQEVLMMFHVNATLTHKELLAALRTGTYADVIHHAHKIRGMASNVGAKRYTELTRQIEEAALAGDLGDPHQWLQALAAVFPGLESSILTLDWQQLRKDETNEFA